LIESLSITGWEEKNLFIALCNRPGLGRALVLAGPAQTGPIFRICFGIRASDDFGV